MADEEEKFSRKERHKCPKRQAYMKEYRKRWYEENKKKVLIGVKRGRANGRRRKRVIVYDHLTSHPCVDCGEADPVVLEFDHRDPKKKSFSISRGIRDLKSDAALKAEIKKCDIRCSNCHRRRTSQQFGDWKLDMEKEEEGGIEEAD